MPITYDATNNLRTVTGYAQGAECNYNDFYNHDKSNSLQLLAPTAAGLDLSLSRQVRPADDKALKLNIIITNFSVAGDVTLTGQDKDGNAQTETVNISGNGTYVTTRWFKSIDAAGVDCTGTYTIEITQSRLGIVWKEGNCYIDTAKTQIGDGITISWFALESVVIIFKANTVTGNYQNVIFVKNNGRFRIGRLVDATKKITDRGCMFYSEELAYQMYGIPSSEEGADIQIYGSVIHAKFGRVYCPDTPTTNKIYNSRFLYTYEFNAGTCEIYNLQREGAYSYDVGIRRGKGTIEQFRITGCYYAVELAYAYATTIKNLTIRKSGYNIFLNSLSVNAYLINADIDDWTSILYAYNPTGKLYRQVEFDVHVQDKNGNPLSGVSVTAEYITPYGTAFTQTTDANGDIATQTVYHGWFEQATGSAENLKTPLKVTYSKAGFQTTVKHYTLAEKTRGRVVMHKAVGVFTSLGTPVVNLRKSDPENKSVMVL